MYTNLEGRFLIHLLFCVLYNKQPYNPPEGIDWRKFYRVAAEHGVANMVYYKLESIENTVQLPKEIVYKFQIAYKKALAKEAMQHLVTEELLARFEENSIFCIPLKGSIIKYLYPKPDMRLMSDVDILFKDEQSKRIKELMLKLGFNIYHLGGNHDVYTKEPYISIEMHRRLVDKSSSYSEYLGNTWDRAQPKKGSIFIRMLSHEDLFIYMLIHIAKHFLNGGTGVRSIIDIHLYKKNYDVNMDWNYIWYELDKIKLRRFTESIITLGDIWFGDCQSNNLYDYLTDYILSSGAYGTKENARLSVMAAGIKFGKVQSAQNIGHGRLHYMRKLFFPPIEKIQSSYPILEKIPFLLPFCWMLRGISCLLFKQKRTFKIIGGINTVSDDDVNKLRDLYDGIGILNGINKWLSDKQIIDN